MSWRYDAMAGGQGYSLDDYVWLDGRAVAVFRSGYTSAWARQADLTGTCTRNGEAADCDVYFPVTDHIGKPVVTVNSQRQVSGVGEYDPYGMLNRANYWGETAHPYANNVALQTLADWDYKLLGMQLDVRAHFNQFDLDGCGGDYVVLKDGVSGANLYNLRERKQGDTWFAWRNVPSGRVKVDFHSDDRNCTPAQSCSCKAGGAYAYSGAALKEFELRRHQSTNWYFPPLRFPGQYFDAETDWHENWNRLYDPQTARYLQQEPLLLGAGYARDQGLGGFSTASYAYTRNNPIMQHDRSGLRTPNIPGGMSGRLCLSKTCKPIPPDKSLCKPEDDGPLTSLPDPGECKEVDGLYSSAGTWKIPDNCTCHILCDPTTGGRTGGDGMLCSCLPVPGRSSEQQRPQWSRDPVLGWPRNPLLAP